MLSARVSIREIQHVVHPDIVKSSPIIVKLFTIILSLLAFTTAMLAYQIRDCVLMTGYLALKRMNLREMEAVQDLSNRLIDEYYIPSHYYSPGVCLECRRGEKPEIVEDTSSASNNCRNCGRVLQGHDVFEIEQEDYISKLIAQKSYNL